MGSWLGPAVTAAFISSLIAALGWYVSFRTARGAESRRRDERVRDVQTAILAEIRSAVHHLRQYERSEILEGVRRRTQESPTYVPFIATEPSSPLYRSIAGEISILPNAVIDAVVLFYRQQEVIAYFADDLRGDRFAAMPGEEKIRMIEDYLALRDYAAALGQDAVQALETSLGQGVSRPGEDRSGRKSASDEAWRQT
ncbi:hypothetical protein [Jiella avicenniae]|uniref:DUF4760 domain-containing protein n=1 Tax=Jiella avicenniae TaxID=2907202 RepID=A0A9X1NYZ5_9HYPH|nr:hypothetical protein [Jiella avicenniae]MCE7026734.1 hypothetical protein [Jiella avicenniae]